MSTEMTLQITSTDLNDTLRIAAKIGVQLRGSEIIELVSDLGGGKTSFVRGLAEGMGSRDAVRSPSFTLSNQYKANDLTLYHFDFYRLHEPGILREELAEIIEDPQAVVAIEWGQIIDNILPSDRLRLEIRATDENTRQLTFTYPATLEYLVDNIKG